MFIQRLLQTSLITALFSYNSFIYNRTLSNVYQHVNGQTVAQYNCHIYSRLLLRNNNTSKNVDESQNNYTE